MPNKVRRTTREFYYNTQEVLQQTLISRASLIKYVKSGKFPAPKDRTKGSDWYDKQEVHDWVANNSNFVKWRQKKISEEITIVIEAKHMEYIREACELLECNEVDFIRDAATWKANQVKKLVANNVPFI